MLYVMFEAMEVDENATFTSKSTILDGRRRRRCRRRRRENVEIKPPQPPVGIWVGDGSGAELGKNKTMLVDMQDPSIFFYHP